MFLITAIANIETGPADNLKGGTHKHRNFVIRVTSDE
jgi:hypothetical protein